MIHYVQSILRPRIDKKRVAPHFEVGIEAPLLLSISLGGAEEQPPEARRAPKIIGSSRSLSESALAFFVPPFSISKHDVTQGRTLDIKLEISPGEFVQMACSVISYEWLDGTTTQGGHLIGVRITQMSHYDRARYVEYIAMRGWEQIASAPGMVEVRPYATTPA